jgi:eukaryotic-like serine/threonine-protein kinase
VSVQSIDSTEPAGTVVRQSIGAGATVPQGTTVTIWVSTGVAPVAPLPDFRGMTFEEAQEAAEQFTFDTNVLLNLVREEVPVQDQNQIGRVVGTNPDPGTAIEESAQVVLQIGVQAPPPPPDDDDEGDD